MYENNENERLPISKEDTKIVKGDAEINYSPPPPDVPNKARKRQSDATIAPLMCLCALLLAAFSFFAVYSVSNAVASTKEVSNEENNKCDLID